ncbi:MAG: serine--tRNA ligase [Phototrophicales bacterium]|nr:MAG: serine--tRNA ligase [Phototrophicales bacterium]RMG72180.1 MAG: serine--tRNA ligase [Chloroflexota bacterium]
MLKQVEVIQANRNKLNKNVGRLRGDKKLDDTTKAARAYHTALAIQQGDYDQAIAILDGTIQVSPAEGDLDTLFNTLTDALRGISDRVNTIHENLKPIEDELNDHMLWLPNLPHESVPVADSDEFNIAWEPEGEFRQFDFTPKPHWEIGPELGIIDFERGVKLAGTRAYILRGWGARLQRALENFFLDMARQKGFEEVYVPFFVKKDMLYGAGQFPKFTDVVYFDPDADIYMLPTAEVAITNFFRDEILDEADLPLYFVANTPCFRREKTSAGRDTRGIKRVHQFQKVEMYKFTHPDTSYDELESLVEAASDICRALKIPFRRLEIVTGDLGFSASKKYDIEMWAPGVEEWLEVSSCSNTEAFQARRANIRFRPTDGKKTQFVHTLNGSGLGMTRVIIAILENYQQADGSVIVPEVLRPYIGGVEVITKP